MGAARFPEGFQKAVQKENHHSISQTSQCKQSDPCQPAMALLQAQTYDFGYPLRHMLFLSL